MIDLVNMVMSIARGEFTHFRVGNGMFLEMIRMSWIRWDDDDVNHGVEFFGACKKARTAKMASDMREMMTKHWVFRVPSFQINLKDNWRLVKSRQQDPHSWKLTVPQRQFHMIGGFIPPQFSRMFKRFDMFLPPLKWSISISVFLGRFWPRHSIISQATRRMKSFLLDYERRWSMLRRGSLVSFRLVYWSQRQHVSMIYLFNIAMFYGYVRFPKG